MTSAKLGRMLFSIASTNVGYRGVHPKRRNFALLTRLLLSPRLRSPFDFPIGGSGRFNLCASQRRDDAAAGEHRPFRFKKYAARLAHWFCLALFRNPGAVALRVNAGAACKEQF